MNQKETFTPVRDLGEFGLIDRMAAILEEPDHENIIAGISDDAAVYRVSEHHVHLVTTDALIENVHFDRAFTPMEYLGFKSLSVNVSDIVAMNASPLYATVSLGLPQNLSVEMVESFYRGLKKACDRYGVTILGGDTTASHRITISITVIGEAEENEIVYRSGAQPGDLLCVTGNLGGAYAGLKVLLDQRRGLSEEGDSFIPNLEPFSYVIQRQLTPVARLEIIRDWTARSVRPHALIDISDGLASEVNHICRLSHCGALLHASALPMDLETRTVADTFAEDVDTYALFGGEDYELLFALPPDDLEKLDPDSFTVVGVCTDPSEGVRIQTFEGEISPLNAAGYQHFREDG